MLSFQLNDNVKNKANVLNKNILINLIFITIRMIYYFQKECDVFNFLFIFLAGRQ